MPLRSKYYSGIPRIPREDQNGREILDPKRLRTSVDDVKSISDLKSELFINNRVLDDSNYTPDEHQEDFEGEEFTLPGLSRYEEYALVSDEQSDKIRKARLTEIFNENKAKREKYEQQQRNNAKRKYGLVDPSPLPKDQNSQSEDET